MNTLASRSIQQKRWIALLGRRDVPTDGVEDYCIFLGNGLAMVGVELKRVRVPWLDKGWIRFAESSLACEHGLAGQLGAHAIHGVHLVT